MNGVSGYERLRAENPSTPALNLGSGISSSLSVSCPAGKRAIAGSHEFVSLSAQQLNVTTSVSVDTPTVSSWRLVFRNPTSNLLMNVQVRVHVLCAFVQ